jgi:hypothetical protein
LIEETIPSIEAHYSIDRFFLLPDDYGHVEEIVDALIERYAQLVTIFITSQLRATVLS